MNDADKHFGPKKPAAMPSARRSCFGRYPDVQELCDTFADAMEWKLDGYTIRQIAAGARDFKLAIGNEPKLLLRATQKMKKKKLSVSSPRSCITAAREMVHSPDADSQENRDRYLKGVEDGN